MTLFDLFGLDVPVKFDCSKKNSFGGIRPAHIVQTELKA